MFKFIRWIWSEFKRAERDVVQCAAKDFDDLKMILDRDRCRMRKDIRDLRKRVEGLEQGPAAK